MSRFHKLLRIDLNTSTYHIENINQKDEEMFLGGKGLGTAFLVRELAAGIDPLGPENKMIIAAGPLTGTSAPASSRFEIVTKSPLTGLYLDCSSGGHFGQELKATGFDLVIIEGVSKDPVDLYIHNEQDCQTAAPSHWRPMRNESHDHGQWQTVHQKVQNASASDSMDRQKDHLYI